eukprot:1401959-Rhodomonas_salina.2
MPFFSSSRRTSSARFSEAEPVSQSVSQTDTSSAPLMSSRLQTAGVESKAKPCGPGTKLYRDYFY